MRFFEGQMAKCNREIEQRRLERLRPTPPQLSGVYHFQDLQEFNVPIVFECNDTTGKDASVYTILGTSYAKEFLANLSTILGYVNNFDDSEY